MKNVFFFVLLLIPYYLSSSVTHIWPSSGVNDTFTMTHIFSADSTDGVLSVELQRNGYLTV